MKRTYRPSLLKMKRRHGFRCRSIKVLLRRIHKGRFVLSR